MRDHLLRVPLTAAEYLALRHCSDEQGVGMAGLVRLAVSRYLKEESNRLARLDRANDSHDLANDDD